MAKTIGFKPTKATKPNNGGNKPNNGGNAGTTPAAGSEKAAEEKLVDPVNKPAAKKQPKKSK